ncbi:MAG: ABC transporter substrate-binding protein [Tissierellia bacterium]|nr:ABC transporter substrate-binding protein [Tissierellia bacterium]
MKKGFLLLLILALIFLTACGKDGSTNQPTNTDSRDTLVVAQPADVSSFDPHNVTSQFDISIMRLIYDPLVREKNGDIVGVLAKSWEMAEDAMSCRFEINTDAKFSNGDSLLASDVAFSFNRAVKMPAGQLIPGIKDAIVEDDTHVVVNFVAPNQGFIPSLIGFYVVQEKSVIDAGDMYGVLDSDTQVGTGPYVLVERKPGENIVFKAREDYFGGSPKIKNVTYKIIADSNTAYLGLQNEEIDFYATDLPSSTIKQIESSDSNLQVIFFPSRPVTFVGMQCTQAPFDNKKVRQAVAYAIDKQEVIDLAQDGIGDLAHSVWNELTFGYSEDVKGNEQNIEKAKQLLTDAGYPTGFSTSISTISKFQKEAEVVQGQLAKIGIETKVELVDETAFVPDIMQGKYNINCLSISMGGDAAAFEGVFQTKSSDDPSVGAVNMFFYSNPQVDQLFKDAKVPDQNERLEKFKQIATILNEDVPLVPLYFQRNSFTAAKGLTVGPIDATGQYFINDFSW